MRRPYLDYKHLTLHDKHLALHDKHLTLHGKHLTLHDKHLTLHHKHVTLHHIISYLACYHKEGSLEEGEEGTPVLGNSAG